MLKVRLGDYINVKTGKLDANASSINGLYPFFTCSHKPLNIDFYCYDCECILVAGNGDLNVKYYHGKFNAYQRTYIIEAKNHEELSIKYLYHFMSLYVETLRHLSIGGVIKYIKLNNLTDVQIPLPPLPEQHRIAAILDAADEIRKKRQQALALCDEFLKSTFLDMFGDPVTNPKGWDKKNIGELLSNIDSGWSPKCDNVPASSGCWGVLKLSAVTSCNYVQEENKALFSDVSPRPVLEVKKGDVLFSRKNTYELVAACAYVTDTCSKLMLSDLIFRLVIKDTTQLNPIYLWKLLTEHKQRSEIQSLAGGAAGSMPNISKAKLKEVRIPVPPFLLQQKFAAIVEKTETMKARLKQSIAESENLFNSLSQRAFKGEL